MILFGLLCFGAGVLVGIGGTCAAALLHTLRKAE